MNRNPECGCDPTLLLFRDDAKLDSATAKILAVESAKDGISVILDRTIFYPEGGGQACDSGTIEGRKVLSVDEKGGIVRHRLEAALVPGPGEFLPGRSVELVLDVSRRMDFTEQHSAQHLLSATILSLCGAPTLSMHLGAEKSNIDVDIPFMDQSLLERIEGLVNERIAMDLPLRLHLCPPENLDSFPLRKKPPQGEEILRIVDIGGIDYSPCCGTHVESTLRLRLIALTGAEKYKGMTRLGFVAGERACRYLSARSAMLDRAASSLGVGVMDISDRIASLSTRLHSRELDFDVLLALAARQSADLALSAEGAGSVRLELRATMMSAQVPMREEGEGWMTLAFEGDDAASCATFALECARALAAAGRPALVASIRDRTVCVELPAGFGAGRPDSGALPLKPLLSALCAESGGRGGGSGLSFRATFADRAGCERFMKAAGALELRRSPPSGKI